MDYQDGKSVRAEWLASLKPGDKAVIPGRWSHPGTIVSVERMTATQFVMNDGCRFRRDSGSAVGRTDKWHISSLQPVTSNFVEAIEKHRLGEWLERVSSNRKSLSLETLRALRTAYDDATKTSD